MTTLELQQHQKEMIDNTFLREQIETFLNEQYGIETKLKGTKYMVDILLLAKSGENFSSTLNEKYKYLANRYGIQETSIQRQLRYACTLKSEKKIKPKKIMVDSFKKLKLKGVYQK